MSDALPLAAYLMIFDLIPRLPFVFVCLLKTKKVYDLSLRVLLFFEFFDEAPDIFHIIMRNSWSPSSLILTLPGSTPMLRKRLRSCAQNSDPSPHGFAGPGSTPLRRRSNRCCAHRSDPGSETDSSSLVMRLNSMLRKGSPRSISKTWPVKPKWLRRCFVVCAVVVSLFPITVLADRCAIMFRAI